jgi:hypothetical protein
MYIVEKRSENLLGFKTEKNGKIDIQKIENVIFQKYHFSLIECTKNPCQLDGIIRTTFGQSHILLEKVVLENALDLATAIESSNKWITIHDNFLISAIYLTYSDKKKRRILKVLSNRRPRILAEIVDLCGLSEDTAYKKIDELIRDGMLIERDVMYTADAREIKKYVIVFKNLKFGILKNEICVRTKLSKSALKASHINTLLESIRNQMDETQHLFLSHKS